MLKKIKNRNKRFAQRKKNLNNSHLKSIYNKFRNFINHQNYFENYNTDMKKAWIGIRNIVNTERSNFMNPQITANGKHLTSLTVYLIHLTTSSLVLVQTRNSQFLNLKENLVPKK